MVQDIGESPPPGWRFRLGIGFFVFAWMSPLFVPLVATTNLSTELKATISGLLFLGGPEVFSLVSIALLGKAGFTYIKDRAFVFLRRAAPQAKVSRTRYRFGLGMWALLLLFNIVTYYTPDLVPGYEQNRTVINLGADAIFIASFFVLGGDFWDKFRALFNYEARAVFPEEKESTPAIARR